MKKHIPNIITLFNLFCGCLAVVSVLFGQFIPAFWFFFTAVAADYFDGFVARLLDVHSPMGKELDSLADMVSFGLLPGTILYMLLIKAHTGQTVYEGVYWPAAPAFLVTLFSALRLAKFNLDTRQTDYFMGLPTPSSTTFCIGLMLIAHFDSFGWGSWVTEPVFLYGCTLFLSYILVAELPMFNLKFKQYSWAGNQIKYTFAAVSIILLVLLQEAAFSVVILLYVLLSVILKWTGQPV